MAQIENQTPAQIAARAFGAAVRRRRRALRMTQEDLSLATNLGRTFIIDLESGKATSQLGPSLAIAEALGMSPVATIEAMSRRADQASELPEPEGDDGLELPDEEDPDGSAPRIF